jgi:YfiH family protein
MTELHFLQPDWPAAEAVQARVTTRLGGTSEGPYASFNLAMHVHDDPQRVAHNRALLKQSLQLPAEPLWLEQVHGVQVTDATDPSASRRADAAFSDQPDVVCAVMTADCLPLLLCNRRGSMVAAAHAGWRGLQAGVIEHTVAALDEAPGELLVWLGPAIGPDAFEVGDEVKQAFEQQMTEAAAAFRPSRPGHWWADIYLLARQRLQRLGIEAVYGGGLCTYEDAQRFYSYRRDGETGRMASLIWIRGKA